VNLDTILGERLAILGGTGSGKSYAARGLAERILARGDRAGVIDPTGVWWGLRSDFPVVLFGGDHADLPLTEHAGRVVAQAVATSQQSWIIDTSALQTKAAERRFMLDFLDALFGANRAPITLIVDEADRFSPQRMSPETTRLHERMEEIVRRGRVRGFTPWLITQRPASLNKDVLSQATALICMRMTGAQDRSAIGDVIEGQADKPTAKAIIDAMPRHKVGEGMVWAPMQEILLPVKFPRIKTFDSMSADTAHKHADRKLPPIDVDSLKEKLASVEAETKANDPAALKKRIRELEAEIAKKAAAGISTDAQHALVEAARTAGYSEGLKNGLGITEANIHSFEEFGRKIVEIGRDMAEAVARGVASIAAERTKATPTAQTGLTHRPALYVPAPAQATRQPGGPNTGGKLAKAERLILTVLAQRHPERVPVERIAAIAGYAAGGGGFNNALSSLRGKAFIEPGPSPLAITRDGLMMLGDYEPLPTGRALLSYWMGRVGKAERAILGALSGNGHHDKESIAAEAGYAPDGGGFNNALSRLRTLGLITGRGTIELHEDLR
jgi:hypothetical protein